MKTSHIAGGSSHRWLGEASAPQGAWGKQQSRDQRSAWYHCMQPGCEDNWVYRTPTLLKQGQVPDIWQLLRMHIADTLKFKKKKKKLMPWPWTYDQWSNFAKGVISIVTRTICIKVNYTLTYKRWKPYSYQKSSHKLLIASEKWNHTPISGLIIKSYLYLVYWRKISMFY